MNGMSPQLKVVFDLVSNLRRETHRNIFSFKLSEILSRLDDSGDSTKYGIDAKRLRELLNELAESGFVRLDYVEEIDLGDNRVDYRWKYGKDNWVYEEVQVGQDIRDFFGKIYFNISQSEIKAVNDSVEKNISATLGFVDPSFVVSCGNEKYTLPQMKEGAPLSIVEYILNNKRVDEPVPRSELASKCQYHKTIEDTSLKDIFKGNSQVKILSPFITIRARYIMIKQAVKLTAQELQTIKEASK